MKNIFALLITSLILVLGSCSKEVNEIDSGSFDDLVAEGGGYKSGSSGSSSSSNNNNNNNNSQGLITAAEWNDLSNWDFWINLQEEKDFTRMPEYWGIYTNQRISIKVESFNIPIADAKVELLKDGEVIWQARTDNFGHAELWISMFTEDEPIDLSDLYLRVNDKIQNIELVLFENGINKVEFNSFYPRPNVVELSFIVDATGSMSDELEFLKDDLKSVIDDARSENDDIDIYTSTVFYRDEGDEYVVKKSEFSKDLNITIDFIKNQSAGGGGDFPEAVHTALFTGINELQWSETARTRIAFLLLDAPPHYQPDVVKSIHNTIQDAAKKGIKVIPVTASGIDKETEFIMRYMSILTNGTYVFITNDSGIGNDHIAASVGDYEVEYLKDLMIRLIRKYSQ